MLVTTAVDFPLKQWDRLLLQVKLCIKHLLPFKPHALISAYAGIHGGAYDFRAHPIAPAETEVLIHDKPSWTAHDMPRYYLGLTLKHYRYHEVLAKPSQSVRNRTCSLGFPMATRYPTLVRSTSPPQP